MLFGTLLQSDVCLLNVKKEKHHVFRQDPSVWEELLYEAIYKLFEVYKSTGRKIFHKLKIFRTAANLPKGGQPPKICSFFF